MQSGDDEVLRGMGRHYTAPSTSSTIAALRAAAPRVNLTTDVIVGFPTEDEAAFERTLEAVDAAGITRVHVFPYSPRPGTVGRGARRPGRAAGEEAPLAGAAGALRGALAPPPRGQARAPRARCWSTRSPTRQCSGYTADYTRCYLPAGAAARGELVDVRLRELHADGIRVRSADRVARRGLS